jgi:hypothetical protein
VEFASYDIGRKAGNTTDYVHLLFSTVNRLGPEGALGVKLQLPRDLAAGGFRNLKASRIKYPTAEETDRISFDAHDLGPGLSLALDEPKFLHTLPPRVKECERPRPRKVNNELVGVLQKWNNVGHLHFRIALGVQPHEISAVEGLFKSDTVDGQIVDRRGPSGFESIVEGNAEFLPNGALFCDLHLTPGETAVGGSSDLESCYMQHTATRERALSTPVGQPESKSFWQKRFPHASLPGSTDTGCWGVPMIASIALR